MCKKPSKIQVVWSDNGEAVSLLLNNYHHSIFDFKEKAGYCRNGFPKSNCGWTQIQNRTLKDDIVQIIFGTTSE